EFIVFIDADCVPEEDCLPGLLAHFADPEVGAVAPRILGHRAPGRSFLHRYEHARSPIDMGAKPSPVRP
ncbi:MAG: glycosyltransferase, partial [Xanthomonadales bacterium]|nr:glycosyltransferase [Xanthomonadales bacterium]